MFKRAFFLFLFSVGIISGCKKETISPNGVPNTAVSFTDDVNQYPNLLTVLGWTAVTGGYSNNGVLLYCQSPNDYLAFDMSCPYDCQTNMRAVIVVQPGNITTKCPVCGTTYSLFTGAVNGGPGSIALKQYYTEYNDPNLSVSSSPF
jgi:nitrite reductase/ring-hydroxylating ferredoxin subunit